MTTRRSLPTSRRAKESLRPPRYRLLSAAAKLPPRPTIAATIAFERDCPGCGRSVLFTQVDLATGPEYRIEEHDCA